MVFEVDGVGTRLKATSAEGSSRWVWDDVTSSVPETIADVDDATGMLTRGFVHGPEGAESMLDAAGWHDLHRSPVVGSIEATTSSTGSIESQTRYSGWGDTTTSSGSLDQPYGFAGERRIGSHLHLRARDYNPSLGIFTGPDPLERPIGMPWLGTYNYAEQNPTTYVDPTGRYGESTVASYEKRYGPAGVRELIGGCGVAYAFGFGLCLPDTGSKSGGNLAPPNIVARPTVPKLDGGSSVGGFGDVSFGNSCYNPFSPFAGTSNSTRMHNASYATRGCGANADFAKQSRSGGRGQESRTPKQLSDAEKALIDGGREAARQAGKLKEYNAAIAKQRRDAKIVKRNRNAQRRASS
jgi:RHS repeat-associated protein